MGGSTGERGATNSRSGDIPKRARPRREFAYEPTPNFASILTDIDASLLISAYHAGELVAVGIGPQGLEVSFHHFERAMGIAVTPNQLAVGTQSAVWFLPNDHDLAARLQPPGRHDACFHARWARFTGEILSHELVWSGNELWVVNTRFSCLCTFDDRNSFVPRWRPKFISALAPEDRCHLNGVAVADGRLKLVTALGETDSAEGWRAAKDTGGCLIDLDTQETVLRGLSLPHSPRVSHGRIWLLESGRGRLLVTDSSYAPPETVTELPGYTRGLSLRGPYAFVGLSRLREQSSTSTGTPIAQRAEALTCGVAVVELASGRTMAFLEFPAGIDEIFDVQVVPGVLSPLIAGPNPQVDGRSVWVLP